jgi:OmpA-OmpF porin, OOP family
MPAGLDQEGDPELQQGHQRGGVSLMRAFGLLSQGLLVGVMALSTLPVGPAQAQTAAPAGDIVEKLIGPDEPAEIDVAALRQQAGDRIKARADAQPQKRPQLAPQLSKLPQVRFDIVFDPDSAVIRPPSYGTVGAIADALTDVKLRGYRFLIVDHVESAGRRDHNLILTQRRADSVRDVLVNTFKISPKRLVSLGLGEEQLQDASKPASPANTRVQIMAIGKMEAVDPKPSTPAGAAQKGAAAAKKKKR